jgi:hypothetical protein
MHIRFLAKHASVEDWGLLLSFLDEENPASVAEQFAAGYGFGKLYEMSGKINLTSGQHESAYSEDPPLDPLSILFFRDEQVILYPYAIVAIIKPDTPTFITRMD